MANWWDAAPLAAQKAAPVAAANWWDAAPLAQEAAPAQAASSTQSAPSVSMPEALGRGVAQGATFNFYDELRGLVEASGANPRDPASLGKLLSGAFKYFSGDKEAEKTYDATKAREVALTKQAETERPYSSLAGNVAGAVAVPVGAALQAATLPARMLRGAAVGAGTGALAGVGDGEGLGGRLTGAAVGGAVGTAVGAAAPGAINLVQSAGRGIANAVSPATSAVRGVMDVDAEAARRIILHRARDNKSASPGMSDAEFAAAKATGSPVVLADRGGESTQALARSAANTSPEGRAALEAVTGERYATQQPRMVQFLKETFGLPEAGPAMDALESAARAANRPAYVKAYAQGQGLWDDGLEQLSQAPVVQQAIRLAFVTGRNKDALAGFPPLKNPFSLNKQTGAFELADGATPNLQFWDHVKRNLDKLGAEGNAFSKALRGHLDDLVPSYKDARSGAAKFFGEEDALEAGAKFAAMSGRDSIKIHEARRGLAAMKPEERKLFEAGFVSNLIAKIESAPPGRDVVKLIFNSETAKQQIQLALGAERAGQLEAQLLTERAMNGLKTAIQGNSTTARQWIERGLAGGATTVGGVSAYNTDPVSMTTAALVGALTFGAKKIDQRVARRVAEMLASDNPAILKRGVDLVAKSSAMRETFRKLDVPVARVGGSQASSVPAMHAAGIGRADEDQQNVPRPPR